MQAVNRREFLGTCLAGGISTLLGRSAHAAAPNDVIEQARLLGMEVLKPSDRDLQHGLELHAKAVVFDVYGFSPNAAVDGDRLADA